MTGKHIRGMDPFQCTPARCVTSSGPSLLSRFTAVAVACAVIAAPILYGQQSNPTEYEVKAAYLYNFGKFVEWPAKAKTVDDSFTICVLDFRYNNRRRKHQRQEGSN
ncbi:MAG: YfiR family protein [Verrucomicrobia bacterium]|nr:MAG: YfiR family protein [Verrucomicrobiota bacterium]